MATLTTPNSDLTDRIQSLPQELIDMIKDEVLQSLPTDTVRHISEDNQLYAYLDAAKPHTLLHVNKATRDKLLTAYYSSTFQLRFATHNWPFLAGPKYRGFIKELQFVTTGRRSYFEILCKVWREMKRVSDGTKLKVMCEGKEFEF